MARGFPELKILMIISESLVEWTEVVNGAFPRFLPKGLQNISKLQELFLSGVHEDLTRRLQGEEIQDQAHFKS
ncbi:conserved hypothetical protein [Ricinus communis]|uniref:Uncharacterized protein n=1 Tax=Ricinus communis TaxID=3988 RepID=B9SGE4_RICCO|nr:conserved hypothetical protein [Ricinus communis]